MCVKGCHRWTGRYWGRGWAECADVTSVCADEVNLFHLGARRNIVCT